jgi:hypothetical protein
MKLTRYNNSFFLLFNALCTIKNIRIFAFYSHHFLYFDFVLTVFGKTFLHVFHINAPKLNIFSENIIAIKSSEKGIQHTSLNITRNSKMQCLLINNSGETSIHRKLEVTKYIILSISLK